MRHLLKEGKIIKYVSKEGGGLSGEVHFIHHKGDRYVVRRCQSLETAQFYEYISKKFEKYGFLPKFLGRYGKDVFYEHIDGRELKKEDSFKVAEQIGRIAAIINKVKVKGSLDERFSKQLQELVSGRFYLSVKEKAARKRNRVENEKIEPVFSKSEAEVINKIYVYLKKRTKPLLTLDSNDIHLKNYILSKGKVYFVDIEAIKPRIKGFGIAKAFVKWFKTEKLRDKFRKGYEHISPMKFYNEEYRDFVEMQFLLQRINYRWKILELNMKKKDYEGTIDKFWNIVNKYKEMKK